MKGVKPWQIVVIVLGVLVGLGSVLWQVTSSEEPEFATKFTFADAESGELFSYTRPDRDSIFVPSIHPTTKQPTLFMVIKEGDQWVVPPRYRGMLNSKMKAVTDAKAGTIKVVGEPKPLKSLTGT